MLSLLSPRDDMLTTQMHPIDVLNFTRKLKFDNNVYFISLHTSLSLGIIAKESRHNAHCMFKMFI